LPVEIVSCGGSGTYLHAARQPGVTEIQAGGGTMGDAFYRALGSPVEPALTLLTTVVSRPTEDRIVLDAGRRAIDPSQKAPTARGIDGVQGIRFSAEHGIMALEGPREWPRVGDRLELEVGYTDQAVHLHESLFAVRDETIVAVWPVAGRGKIH
jgi:D-serine deaminase-like pyridoxal phosphate-dependent protein